MTWNTFASQTTVTTPEFDQNYSALANMAQNPCAVAGVNSLVLTPIAGNPPVSGYQNYTTYVGIAAATNTSSVQAQVSSQAILNVYKDSPAGPVALTGGEIF